MAPYIIYFLIFGLFQSAKCQIAVFDLHLEDLSAAQHGIGWPSVVQVATGNEALMKLRQTLDNMISCSVVSPRGVHFDVNSPPNNKYEKWSDHCGLRVRDIGPDDEGRWRLTASNANNNLTGWILVDVLKETTAYIAPPIALHDGETNAKVDLTSLENAYCVVTKPFSEGSLVPGRCSVTLDRTTRAVQGNWQIYLGLPGSVTELQTNRHVTIQTEHLDVGYIYGDDNKLHLYCNIQHTTKNITFCRFQKTANQYGYNLIDGLSDGTHSYYGKGFNEKECGMTIENPTAEDHGTWRCSVGVQMFVDNHIEQQTPMQALISVAANSRSILARSQRSEEEHRSIFVQEDNQFTLTCSSEVSLAYCWFQHPNGTQFTPVNLVDDEQQFWYTGESLEVGDCGITFAHAVSDDDGKWTCHMGPRFSLGIEMIDSVDVRVTGPLAANQRELPVTIGGNATLYCHTANGRRALHYCRFLSPTFVGMSLDSSITPENAILDRYYFTPEKDINVGDCSLSITSVHAEDIGQWTCAAVVDNEILESSDTITLYIDENQSPSRAGIIGMAVGLSVLVVILVGYMSCKRGWMSNGLMYLYRRRSPPADDYSLNMRSIASTSISSGSSGESTDINAMRRPEA